jgi:hypothetical protein
LTRRRQTDECYAESDEHLASPDLASHLHLHGPRVGIMSPRERIADLCIVGCANPCVREGRRMRSCHRHLEGSETNHCHNADSDNADSVRRSSSQTSSVVAASMVRHRDVRAGIYGRGNSHVASERIDVLRCVRLLQRYVEHICSERVSCECSRCYTLATVPSCSERRIQGKYQRKVRTPWSCRYDSLGLI